jgi:peptidoglycan/xylan/chitin deacetylase (PgdA/CDA1 family)
MILPPGASPVALTFDDSSLSQFKMLPDGTIDPNCAIGILKKFSEEHPDFPVKATFYILPKIPFGQPGFVQQKLALLKQWGCEIGCHTLTHRSLRRMSPDKIKEELGGAIEWIRSLGFEPKTMAVPYGDMPKDASILKSFTWKGKQYGFLANVRSMGRPARSQQAEKPEDPLRVPRLIGSDEPLCLTDWLDKVKKGEVGLYVQP